MVSIRSQFICINFWFGSLGVIMNRSDLKKRLVVVIISIIISLVCAEFLSSYILKLQNIFEYDENTTTFRIHMLDEIPEGSYGHEMRIVNICINGEWIDLQKYDNEGYVWHGEWGYTLYKDSDCDFIIEYFEPIKRISMEYVEQEGSGVAEIYVGDKKIDELHMYKSIWHNKINYYTFMTENEKKISYVEKFVIIVFLVSVIYAAISNFRAKDRKYGVESTLGMFDAAKGISMVIIIMGHTISLIGPNMPNSLMILLITCIISNGLLPMFYMISGYGFRGERISKCIKKQLAFLLKPYAVMAIATITISGIKTILLDNFSIKDLRNIILSFLSFNTIDSNVGGYDLISVGPIWFCIELCIAWIILNFIFRLKNKKIIFIAVMATNIVGVLLQTKSFNIYSRTQFVSAITFIYVGYLLRDKKFFQKENRFTFIKYILACVSMIIIVCINGFCSLAGNDFGRNYILGVISCVGMGVILLRIYIVINSKINLKILKKIGRVTYDIIFIHSFESFVIPWKKILHVIKLPVFFKIVLILILRCIVIYIIYMVVQMCRKYIRSKKESNIM